VAIPSRGGGVISIRTNSPPLQCCGYYAGCLSTVEINNTFYRMPAEATLARWSGKNAAHFYFSCRRA
jgi:uncharacterized protein YecE (DUF72 family)